MINNTPEIKLGIVAVSRDCFPNSLSENRRKAVVKAYDGEIYECPIIVENEIDMMNALEDLKKQSVMHLLYTLETSDRDRGNPACKILRRTLHGSSSSRRDRRRPCRRTRRCILRRSERKLQPETAQPARIHSGVPGWRCRRRSSHDQRFRTGCNCSCSC